ncbi:hypothetical protein C6P46_004888 [Rhodotorula mucilaginosa]|uniref:Phospholipid/glycerol acyltransferase domain-containing protein n=1 Tax=Rhodotorula mucilaginosa TaxID=5537 RepID=A0A9P7B9Z0_RHOMI|nr:hypothetical protein C6P46_004888 [Rhodotorula mucilaginosa]TKA51782.1 hypothetical protein B0A53_05468 [Rhodotorula sp. CCFEE 5036]
MPFGPTHTLLRGLAGFAFASFWHRVETHTHVDGYDGDPERLVPDEGTPIIVVANHHNSAADVAVLSLHFPHYRKLHYWAKSTLFAPGLPKKILLDAGNLPVDRKTKDNQKLFASSFDALKAGEAIAVFPEGGSDTVHELPELKDGASWAALEYAKNLRDPATSRILSNGKPLAREPQDVVICIAGISYSDKTKYRACAVMQFGPNISVEPYIDEFLVSPKTAVKKLTQRIREELVKVTVNAPDWDSRHAAMMARKILWPDDRKLPLRNLRDIDQTLVDLFATENPSPSLRRLRRLLTTYRDALKHLGVSHLSLSSLPLPETLDPSVPHRLPTRMRVFASIVLSTFACLIRLPFFLLPLLVHLPVYLFARYASSGALEEDQAQNKVAIGLVLALVTYAAFFAVACVLLWTSIPWGGAILVAIVGTIAFVAYHNRLVDANYRRFQQLTTLWTVLIALWTPVAQSEASHFLHSVHPSLSPAPPRHHSHPESPYEPAADGGEEEEEEEDESDTAGLLLNSTAFGTFDSPPTKRAPLPSPTLFSEEDRLLGSNFPHLRSKHQHHDSSGGRPRSRSLQSRSRASLDRSQHDEGAMTTTSAGTTSIEMPDLSSLPTNTNTTTSSRHPPFEQGARDNRSHSRMERHRARRSFAREVRTLLRLRAATVASLREVLFDEDDDHDGGVLEEQQQQAGSAPPRDGDGFGREEERIETPPATPLRIHQQAGAGSAFNFTSSSSGSASAASTQQQGQAAADDLTSRRRGRLVGERMKELGWRGAGLGNGKLL